LGDEIGQKCPIISNNIYAEYKDELIALGFDF
jgi:hypothetical protein